MTRLAKSPYVIVSVGKKRTTTKYVSQREMMRHLEEVPKSPLDKYVAIDAHTCFGKPRFANTRIPLWIIFEFLEAGQSEKEILDNYPGLTKKHIKAAFHFVFNVMENWNNPK